MGDIQENKCGICLTHSLHDLYSFLKALQHRGREAVGIAGISRDRIDVMKWAGPLQTFDLKTIIHNFHQITRGHSHKTFLGHVRYATRGRKDRILEDAHPITIGGKEIHRGNHTYILDCDAIAIHNGQIDTGPLLKKIEITDPQPDTQALLHYALKRGYHSIPKEIPGSYTFIYVQKGKNYVTILRDKHGMMPATLGEKDGRIVFSSEDIALRKNGALVKKDMEPGSAYLVSLTGQKAKHHLEEENRKHCFFQWNYIGDSQSTIEAVSVSTVRRKLGEALALHARPNVDLVTFVPRCPETAAESYAEARNIPFLHVFYKPRSERSFQGPTSEERRSSIMSNLYIYPIINGQPSHEFLKGKRVAMVDDSIIRGNNAKHARDLLLEQGAGEVHLLSYTPKVGIIGKDNKKRGCTFGIDMPPDDDFIAREKTDEEITEAMGMHVHYMPYEAMLDAFEDCGMPREHLCHYCIGGEHPFTGR
ncbi:MAG: hypothetical protein ACOC32_01825 [Nanoarchaeota archaeon]